MGRQPRIECPNASYHVFARGIERKKIFVNRDDYLRFIETIEHALEFAQDILLTRFENASRL